MTPTVLAPGLAVDRQKIDETLSVILGGSSVPEAGPVHEAMRYAVLGGGQRIRPLLAVRTARLLHSEVEWTWRAAAAVEMIHCASLIIDDLPCMDDEALRRDRPTVHLVYGQATAILAAFALVGLAARIVVEPPIAPAHLPCVLHFQRGLLAMLDCRGLVGGQAMDLQLCGESHESDRRRAAERKTMPLFEISVLAGRCFGTCQPEDEELLEQFGKAFGMGFQLVDDFLDGEAVSIAHMEAYLEEARSCAAAFQEDGRELEELIDYLHARAWQKNHRHR